MKTPYQKSCAALALAAIAFAANATAATIAYVGNVEGAQVIDWRTTTTPKTLDIDGNNRYGTFSGYHWVVASVNQQAALSTTPGTAFISTGPQVINGAYADIDHINNFPTNADAGIALFQFTFELTGTASTYAGQIVRIGVMQDVLGSSEWANDSFKGLQIIQTVGVGAGNSGLVPVRPGAAANGVPEMYFFDLTNVTAGDRFQIQALANVGGITPGGQPGYLGPVSFDVIPEPSTALLSGLGLLTLLLRRRR